MTYLRLFTLVFLLVLKLPLYGYVQNPSVTNEMWETVKPYLLPENHPIKQKLDRIFSGPFSVTYNYFSLKKAGFTKINFGQYSECVVATHSYAPGYFFKLYADVQPKKKEWQLLTLRAAGAADLRQAIDQFGYNSMFKVPKKWIYPLPPGPVTGKGIVRKNFILIAEDMHLFSDEINKRMWKEDQIMTRDRLKALYVLMKTQGLADCIYYFNLPFARDGKIALIDTENTHCYPVFYKTLNFYLGPTAQKIWLDIIAKDGAN